jgi:N-acetylmuramoyl-L-alanine amidase
MTTYFSFIMVLLTLFLACQTEIQNPIKGKIICIDPGHGGTASTDSFRVGPGGEREEWINLRIAQHLKDMLEKVGAKVIMTRTTDIQVGLKERAMIALDNQADVFVSIHHNATADTSVNFPIIYFHGNASENRTSLKLGYYLIKQIQSIMFDEETPISLVSDHVIFPGSGTAVLRHTYGIPGVIGEASFFSNPSEEQKLKDNDYNRKEAHAYFRAFHEFFWYFKKPILEKNSIVHIEPFPVLQEADRMSGIAKLWKQDFAQAKELFKSGNTEALQKALELFTRSARSFPDSWLAAKAHYYRTLIFERLGKTEKTEMEKKRIKEYYALDGYK